MRRFASQRQKRRRGAYRYAITPLHAPLRVAKSKTKSRAKQTTRKVRREYCGTTRVIREMGARRAFHGAGSTDCGFMYSNIIFGRTGGYTYFLQEKACISGGFFVSYNRYAVFWGAVGSNPMETGGVVRCLWGGGAGFDWVSLEYNYYLLP